MVLAGVDVGVSSTLLQAQGPYRHKVQAPPPRDTPSRASMFKALALYFCNLQFLLF